MAKSSGFLANDVQGDDVKSDRLALGVQGEIHQRKTAIPELLPSVDGELWHLIGLFESKPCLYLDEDDRGPIVGTLPFLWGNGNNISFANLGTPVPLENRISPTNEIRGGQSLALTSNFPRRVLLH